MDGSFNQAMGLDALLRVTGDEYLKIVWGQTFENDVANKPLSFSNARYIMNWERRRTVGFHYRLFSAGTGPDYNPGIGFQHRLDYHMYGGRFNYTSGCETISTRPGASANQPLWIFNILLSLKASGRVG